MFSKGIEFLCQRTDDKCRKKDSYSEIISNIVYRRVKCNKKNPFYNAKTDSGSPLQCGIRTTASFESHCCWGV
jgi:hypothetical protein